MEQQTQAQFIASLLSIPSQPLLPNLKLPRRGSSPLNPGPRGGTRHLGSPEAPGASTRRVRRFRARLKQKKLQVERLAKIARQEERDRIRVSKGLLPLAEANRKKAIECRQRAQDQVEMIEASWLAPSIRRNEMLQLVKLKHPTQGYEFHLMVVEGIWDECVRTRTCFNRFALFEGVEKAMHERVVFSELVEAGVPIFEAWQRRSEPFIPKGKNNFELMVDRKTRYQKAAELWAGRENEIINSLLTLTAKRLWFQRHPSK